MIQFLQPTSVDIGDMVELLIPELYPPFQSTEQEKEVEEAARLERVKKHAEWYSERDEGAALARREREEAEVSGRLTPDAEAFLDLKLRPRIKQAHEYEPVIRTPVVQGLFFRNTLAWVAGTSGTFKSFVTADLAFRYGAEDMDYHGRRMTSGRALLIVAEGAAGYADRRSAWEKEHQREVKDVDIYPFPLQLADTLKEMPALISYLRQEEEAGRPITLIVFDTQAMCTVGIDENTSEMNLVVNMLHRIREVSGACVLVVHHFGKNKSAGMRGSSMIYAAADTVCVLKRKEDENEVTLSTAQSDEGKQKDAITEKDFLTLDLRAHPVGEDYFGDPVFSLVPVEVDVPPPVPAEEVQAPETLPAVTDKQMPYLKAISYFRHHGAGQTELAKKMCEDEGTKITYPALVRSTMIGLEDKGLVEIQRGKWRLTPTGGAVILRELSERENTERAWVERKPRRRPVKPSQDDVFPDVSEPPENIDQKHQEE